MAALSEYSHASYSKPRAQRREQRPIDGRDHAGGRNLWDVLRELGPNRPGFSYRLVDFFRKSVKDQNKLLYSVILLGQKGFGGQIINKTHNKIMIANKKSYRIM